MSIYLLPRRSIPAALPGVALLLMMALMVFWASPAHADDAGDDFVSGEVVVKLNPASGATIDDINADYDTTTLEELLGSRGIYLMQLPSGSDTEAVAENLEADPRLLYAEPNLTTETPEGDRSRWRAWNVQLEGDRSRWRAWGEFDLALYTGQPAADALNMSCAQNISRGEGAVVAVLDTGVQLDHPELANSLTSARYDFVDDDSSPADEPNGRDDDGDGDVDELVGHGTHVAGIVDLVAPESRIMPLRVLDSDGNGDAFVLAEAVLYAAENGADVINLSLGSSQESELLGDVIEDLTPDDDNEDDDGPAIENLPTEGVVVAAAAGNLNTEALHYPAAGEDVIAVTSVDGEERKSEFASYGAWVDIATPGELIYSAFPTSGYARMSGTSMSTPFVAGQAALIRSLEPSREPTAVERLIRDTARPLDASNPSYAGKLGAGHADIGASLGCGGGTLAASSGSNGGTGDVDSNDGDDDD